MEETKASSLQKVLLRARSQVETTCAFSRGIRTGLDKGRENYRIGCFLLCPTIRIVLSTRFCHVCSYRQIDLTCISGSPRILHFFGIFHLRHDLQSTDSLSADARLLGDRFDLLAIFNRLAARATDGNLFKRGQKTIGIRLLRNDFDVVSRPCTASTACLKCPLCQPD
jgi:hypothetical protein